MGPQLLHLNIKKKRRARSYGAPGAGLRPPHVARVLPRPVRPRGCARPFSGAPRPPRKGKPLSHHVMRGYWGKAGPAPQVTARRANVPGPPPKGSAGEGSAARAGARPCVAEPLPPASRPGPSVPTTTTTRRGSAPWPAAPANASAARASPAGGGTCAGLTRLRSADCPSPRRGGGGGGGGGGSGQSRREPERGARVEEPSRAAASPPSARARARGPPQRARACLGVRPRGQRQAARGRASK